MPGARYSYSLVQKRNCRSQILFFSASGASPLHKHSLTNQHFVIIHCCEQTIIVQQPVRQNPAGRNVFTRLPHTMKSTISPLVTTRNRF